MSWQYLAGFIDGEGCIHARKSPKGKKFYVRIVISQAHYQFLTDLYEEFGEVGALVRGRKVSDKNETLRWQIHRQDQVKMFLEKLMPYLKYKKPQAEVALALLDNPRSSALADELKFLKKRGLYGLEE